MFNRLFIKNNKNHKRNCWELQELVSYGLILLYSVTILLFLIDRKIDQTLTGAFTVCNSACIFLMHYTMVKPNLSGAFLGRGQKFIEMVQVTWPKWSQSPNMVKIVPGNKVKITWKILPGRDMVKPRLQQIVLVSK